jgi:hypothetical protein
MFFLGWIEFLSITDIGRLTDDNSVLQSKKILLAELIRLSKDLFNDLWKRSIK